MMFGLSCGNYDCITSVTAGGIEFMVCVHVCYVGIITIAASTRGIELWSM